MCKYISLTDERSRLIREALDIVQEVSFYKVLAAMGGSRGGVGGGGLPEALDLEIQSKGGWQQLCHEVQENSARDSAHVREREKDIKTMAGKRSGGMGGGGGRERSGGVLESGSRRAVLRWGECVLKTNR